MKTLSSKNKKIVIVSDSHQNIGGYAQLILDCESDADHFIFLGDYFDTFRTPDGAIIYGMEQTCCWLNETFEKLGDKAVWLAGNHDIAYLASYIPNSPRIDKNFWYNCSGWTASKASSFNKTINPNFVKNLELCCQVDDFMCVHAGFHYDQFKPFLSEQDNIEDMYDSWEKDKQAFKHKPFHWIWNVSGARMGPDDYSSPVWLDWNEFEPLDNIKQIVGHSALSRIKEKGGSLCIDTNQDSYLVIENGVVYYKRIQEIKPMADFSKI